MYKIIRLIILGFAILFLSISFTQKVNAACSTTGYFVEFGNSNSGTTWGIAFQLQHPNGSIISGYLYGYLTQTTCAGPYTSQGLPQPIDCLDNDYGNLNTTNDGVIHWYTACVDPTNGPQEENLACGVGFYVDASCYPNGDPSKYMCKGGATNLGPLGWDAVCPTCPVGSCCKGGNQDVCTAFEGCTGCTYKSFSSCNYSQAYVQGNPVWCNFTSHANDSRCNSQPGCGPTPTPKPAPSTTPPPTVTTNPPPTVTTNPPPTCEAPEPGVGCNNGGTVCNGCCVVGGCGTNPTPPPSGSCYECSGTTCVSSSASPCITSCANNCQSSTCP